MLKSGAANALITLLEPIQADFQASPEWQQIERQAYPPPEIKKKEKKVKDKGTKRPILDAAKGVEAQPDGHVEGIRKDEVNLSSGADTAMEKLDIKSNGT